MSTRRRAREPAEESEVAGFTGPATINDIARLAGVSKKTVSRVINASPLVRAETREKVAGLMRQVGYVPDPQARGLAFRRAFLIGLVYDNPNAQYIVNVQNGALDALRGSGFELVVHPCESRSDDFIEGVCRFVQRQKLHGAILLPPVSENEALAEALERLDVRYVRVGSVPFGAAARTVVSNDRAAAVEVAEYLVGLGHRAIGLIAGPHSHRSAHERAAGFGEVLARHGIELPPERVVEGGYTFESGVACAGRLLALASRPTAIFACNDEMAAGAYTAAYRMGLRVPEDVSIVGFDDSPLAARLWPALTTVRLPIRDMGRQAAALLLDPAAAAPAPLTPHLAVRDSCGPPAR
ncbi:LacI family DNA-binding transcriptional regulator [Coralloluteibacterium thermophilus]|uniref:LacI family DNA-binding transcriptional regulator n=1 Tax=Coralloluteibacterium thermophilum TaxID=2707049 RepID=A0ABV9NQ06_9GAMM